MSERHDGYVMGPIHMVRMEHSEEPWESLDSGPSQNIEIHHHNVHIATVPPGGEQDARRIIACVNVLASWSTEELEAILARGSQIRKVPDGQ